MDVLSKAHQLDEKLCHDPEVMGLNPCQVKLRCVLSFLVSLKPKLGQRSFTSICLKVPVLSFFPFIK